MFSNALAAELCKQLTDVWKTKAEHGTKHALQICRYKSFSAVLNGLLGWQTLMEVLLFKCCVLRR